MSEGSQISVPPSFVALHVDARQRLTVSAAELAARYELCEDLAQHLTEHCRGIHVEVGVDTDEVLERCRLGLCQPESGVGPDESVWVVTRLAELLGWPHPGLPERHG
jgi:hypothetical protein